MSAKRMTDERFEDCADYCEASADVDGYTLCTDNVEALHAEARRARSREAELERENERLRTALAAVRCSDCGHVVGLPTTERALPNCRHCEAARTALRDSTKEGPDHG